ncbi:MAG: amidohydrolase [Candidatus Saccharicenans sp.]|uniref:amidohydrolase n=1 Tax=Candidatus Saccharicenans sp. TaxID=2819258 RepID=UPI004048F0D4
MKVRREEIGLSEKLSKTLKVGFLLLIIILLTFSLACSRKREAADLILLNGDIFTMEPDFPQALALVIKGNKIIDVCQKDSQALKYRGPSTRVVDLQRAFVTPGIIDAHVHFNQAGALINDANLMKVSDEPGLRKEIERVVNLLEKGEWITGGLWGAYEQWALGEAGKSASLKKKEPWRPHRRMIDDLTPENPVFVCRYDYQEWLANTAALKAAGLDKKSLKGLELDQKGQPTGIVFRGTPAFQALIQARKPKSETRLLNENRAALKALREAGIVEIHDIATPDQIDRFVKLQENGELTCRVWLRPDLSLGARLKEQGLTMGLHPKTKQKDSWLRYGALKGYIDGIMGTHGALFFEPYNDQPENYGHWRHHTSDDPELKVGNMEKMYRLIKTGLEAGFVPNVHAIGDRGVAEMLDLYEHLKSEGVDLRGFRVIHAQVIRPQDFPRFKALNVIAEVNPYHIADDMRWMEERIGYERCRGAYAFKSLLQNGAILSFGSDWPGTSAAEYHMHPKYLIYAAVTRQTLTGQPKDGWFPEQRISVEECLKAYTINNAYAAFEAGIRGSLKKGKLADITVFDRNLMSIPPEEIIQTEVIMTIIDGKVVFEKNSL